MGEEPFFVSQRESWADIGVGWQQRRLPFLHQFRRRPIRSHGSKSAATVFMSPFESASVTQLIYRCCSRENAVQCQDGVEHVRRIWNCSVLVTPPVAIAESRSRICGVERVAGKQRI